MKITLRAAGLAALFSTCLLAACATSAPPPESGVIQETSEDAGTLKKADPKKTDPAANAKNAQSSSTCRDIVPEWANPVERTTMLNPGTITPDMEHKENEIASTGNTTNGIFVTGPITVDQSTGDVTIDADIEMFSKPNTCATQEIKEGHQDIVLKRGSEQKITFDGHYVGTIRN